mmetsp:Transcript_13721/g.49178  ORF Transcript_13721/g.49178 Transcript_13721/m.49178 type:complete len:619 (-) Transcript_13721:149-2005(-)
MSVIVFISFTLSRLNWIVRLIFSPPSPAPAPPPRRSEPLAESHEGGAVRLVSVRRVLRAHRPELDAGAHTAPTPRAAVILRRVPLHVLGRPEVRAPLPKGKGMRVQHRHGHSNLRGVLQKVPRRAELADVVPATAVRAAEGERVVRGAVADDGAAARVRDEHRRRPRRLRALFSELNETRAPRGESVVDREPGPEADRLIHVEDVARADRGAVHEVRRIAREAALEEHEPVGARAAVRRGGTVDGERSAGALLRALANNRAALVSRGDLLDDHGRGRLALAREVLRHRRLGPGAVDPDGGHLVHERPAREDGRQLPRVEHARLEPGLVRVAVPEDVRVVVLELESEVVLRLEEVRGGHGAVQLSPPPVEVAVLEKHRPAGFDRHEVRLPALARGDAPLELALRGLHRPLAEHDVHLDLALVSLVRPRDHLHVVEQLEEENVPQRRLRVLDVVQLANLEVVLALDHPRVRPSAVHRLHLVVQEHRLDARDLALDDVRDDVAGFHPVKVRDGAKGEPFARVVPLDDVLHRREDAHGARRLLADLRQDLFFNLRRKRGRALDLERLHPRPDLLAEDEFHRVAILSLRRDVSVHVGEEAGVQERLEVRGEVVLADFVPLARV